MIKLLHELGIYKTKISSLFKQSDNICDVILGTNFNKQLAEDEMDKHVFSHLFIDDTIDTTSTYIYYDIVIPKIRSSTKTCEIIMFAFCHRDIIDNYNYQGGSYFGNRADQLSQMIEEILTDSKVIKTFGIGDILLDDVSIYNSKNYYGRTLTFTVHGYR